LNDYERARIFCFDLLRESSHGSEIMIHIFANIAKAWPFLLNYSGLLENSKSKSSDSFADDKLNTYKIFSDEPHSVINNNKDAASSPSDEANELTLNNTDLEKSDSSKLKRKVRLGKLIFSYYNDNKRWKNNNKKINKLLIYILYYIYIYI